jgi:thiamine pyrophosphate-dependent acetolactate synthase large subunit-like protein
MTKIIRVSNSFYNLLKKWHEEFNREVSLKYFKKKMDFVDFTDFIAKFNLLSIDYSKMLLVPIKKGKKSKKIKFEDFIPI